MATALERQPCAPSMRAKAWAHTHCSPAWGGYGAPLAPKGSWSGPTALLHREPPRKAAWGSCLLFLKLQMILLI